MAKIISLVNQKGGVGKTTSSVNLTTYLASMGKRVLLVDLDPQGNASSGLGVNIGELSGDLYQAMILGKHPREIILHKKSLDFDILPSSQDLAGAEI